MRLKKRDKELLTIADRAVEINQVAEGGEPRHRYDHTEPGQIGIAIEWYHREVGSLLGMKEPLIKRETDE
jgi:hypothetical protein